LVALLFGRDWGEKNAQSRGGTVCGAGRLLVLRRLRARERAALTLDCLFRGAVITTMENGKLTASVPKDTLAITLSNFDYDKHSDDDWQRRIGSGFIYTFQQEGRACALAD
jgi:hypothetical protein